MMPVIISMLFVFAVLRFVGMGTKNRGMYVAGGCAFVTAMAFRPKPRVSVMRGSLVKFCKNSPFFRLD